MKYKQSTYYSIKAKIILLLTVLIMFPFLLMGQLSVHIINYPSNEIIFGGYRNGIPCNIDTIKGNGLFVYSNGIQDKGLYFFLLKDKRIDFPLGIDQSFRITADFKHPKFIKSVTFHGSTDNSSFHQIVYGSDKIKIERDVRIDDPFISAYIKALSPIHIPENISNEKIKEYKEDHFFDQINFFDDAFLNTPLYLDMFARYSTEISANKKKLSSVLSKYPKSPKVSMFIESILSDSFDN